MNCGRQKTAGQVQVFSDYLLSRNAQRGLAKGQEQRPGRGDAEDRELSLPLMPNASPTEN